MGIRVGFSDTEGVVSTFFLIRYQTINASSRETNFARQFSSVSLVHRIETTTERQFFEVCPFIFAVQKNLPDALTKRLPSELAINSPPMANKNPARRRLNTLRRMCDYVQAKHTRQNRYLYMSHKAHLGPVQQAIRQCAQIFMALLGNSRPRQCTASLLFPL